MYENVLIYKKYTYQYLEMKDTTWETYSQNVF